MEYVLRDVATLLALPYYKIYYAHYSGQVPEPRRVGKTRIYTEADLERLRKHYAIRQRKVAKALNRPVGETEAR